MKNSFPSNVFGHAEPDDSVPVSSAEERKLDLIWSNYFKLMYGPERWERCFHPFPPSAPYRWQDYPDDTSKWLGLLRKDRRFLLVVLPITHRRDEDGDVTHGTTAVSFHPPRSIMQEAGGFSAYCFGPIFAELLRPHVEDWQRDAIEWNRPRTDLPLHEEATIFDPPLDVHLLDPENGELAKVRLPRWPFPPPQQPPAPTLAKLIPPPTRPGIGKAMPLPHKKVKKLAR